MAKPSSAPDPNPTRVSVHRLAAGALCSALLTGSAAAERVAESAGALKPSRSPISIRRHVPMPVAFEVNDGQADPRVRFLARGSGYTLFLTSSGAVVAHGPDAVRMTFRGANSRAELSALDPMPGVANYLLGQDRARWRTNIATYAKVRYEGLYPGIDLVFYGNDRQLEFDLIVHPGADARKIRLAFDGARGLKTTGEGDLVARTRGGEIRLRKPTIYQASSQGLAPRAIAGRYRLVGAHTIAFEVGAYDHEKPLVIDPVVVYSTYLGGSGGEQLKGGTQMIAVDANGYAYVTGTTDSAAPFGPGTGGGSTTFVAKLSPDGQSLVYATYIGELSTVDHAPSDWPSGIAVDAPGSVYITGVTGSEGFPVTFGTVPARGNTTMFVAKLDPAGALSYSARFGAFGDLSGGIALGSDGSAYVTGRTFDTSGLFATAGAFQEVCHNCVPNLAVSTPNTDAFVVKFNPTASAIVYATFLGGAAPDRGTAIAVDAAGQAYVTGFTASSFFVPVTDDPAPNFPTTAGAFQALPVDPGAGGGETLDVFVTKLSADGSAAVFSTYLSGAAADTPGSIAADAAGYSYVIGTTLSADFPTTEGAFQPTRPPSAFGVTPAFVTKFMPGGAVAYSTLLAGGGLNRGVGIAADGGGRAYVVGSTDARDFPTVDATQPSLGEPYPGAPGTDAFVSVLNASGSELVFSTYLGGPAFDFPQGVALGSDGSAYVVGVTSHDDDPFFPTTTAALQRQFGGGGVDLFVSRITVGPPPDTAPPVIGAVADVIAEATSAAGASVSFGLPDATDSVDPEPSVAAEPPSGGTFPLGATSVTVTATDASSNSSQKTFNLTVLDTTPPALVVPANITTPATPPGSAVVTFGASAADLVDAAPTTICTPASGSSFPVGTTTVSCTAADQAGNTSASQAFSVIVTPKHPKRPKVKAPKDMKLEAAGPYGASVFFTATATDPIYIAIPVTCAPASGSTFPLGATTVTCSATNDFGMSDREAFIITVRDATDPTIVSLTPSVTLLPADAAVVPVSIAVVVSDLVDSAPACRITRVTGGGKDRNDDGVIDWTISGDLTLEVTAVARKHQDRTYTITVKCTDASGNTSADKTAVVVSPHP